MNFPPKTQIFSISICCFFSFFFSSCSGLKVWPVNVDYESIMFPELNKTMVVELGDTLVDQGTSNTRAKITTFNDVEFVWGGLWKISLGKGSYLAKFENNEFIYFYPLQAKVDMKGTVIDDGEDRKDAIGFAKSKKNQNLLPFVHTMNFDTIPYPKGIKQPAYKVSKLVERHSASFRQQLIYNGRVDDNLRLIYREFSGDMARGDFKQEMQYDLGKSKTIGFKGVRMEVVEASNTQMKYRVLAHFRG